MWAAVKAMAEPARSPDKLGGDRPVDQLAAECGTSDAGNPDHKGFERRRACQERDPDEVADFEPANLSPKLDIINALPASHFLDVLDFHGVLHVLVLPHAPGRRLILLRDLRSVYDMLFSSLSATRK